MNLHPINEIYWMWRDNDWLSRSQQLVVVVFYFLTWHDLDVRTSCLFCTGAHHMNEKKLFFGQPWRVSCSNSWTTKPQLNPNHEPFSALTRSSKLQETKSIPYFMAFWAAAKFPHAIPILQTKPLSSINLDMLVLTRQGPLEFQHEALPFSCAETRKSRFNLSE